MEVLPLKIRQRYFIGLVIAFVIFVPILVLYASGYRLTSDFRIIKTGGIYIEVPLSGASFYVDDKFEGAGSIFQKSFFIQNLRPQTYAVRIERDGYHGWRKEVSVYPQLITNGKALLLPEEVEFTLVTPPVLMEEEGTTTQIEASEALTKTEYDRLVASFTATSTGIAAAPQGATSTILYHGASTTVRELGNIGIWKDAEGLKAWWLGEVDRLPYFFCTSLECEHEILIAGSESSISHFDFFPDDNQFVIVAWPDGVFVTELDTRPPQNIQPLYPVPGATFRVIEGDVYVLDSDQLFRVEL